MTRKPGHWERTMCPRRMTMEFFSLWFAGLVLRACKARL